MSQTSPGGGGEEEDADQGFGAAFIRLKARIAYLFGQEPPASIEEQQMQEMAAIIKTYRGIPDEEEDDADKPFVDRGIFDAGMSVIIILNTVVIGLEVDH